MIACRTSRAPLAARASSAMTPCRTSRTVIASRAPLLLVALVAACGGEDDPAPPTMTPPPADTGGYAPCSASTKVGALVADIKERFTSVQGSVANGVRPVDVPMVEMSSGGCELLRPRTLFCNTPCGGGMTCDEGDKCVPLPENQSVGTVTITGLAAAVEMTSRAPVYFYNFLGTLPHPGFAAGDELQLSATGDGVAAFSIATKGVDALVATTASVALERGQPAVVEWTSAAADPAVKLAIELNIANHGGTPGRIECTADDSGRFEIPAALVTALLDGGWSGFPSLSLTRAGVGSTDTDLGCVELEARSRVTLPVTIPGLTSCSSNDDCVAPQTCQPDLTCG